MRWLGLLFFLTPALSHGVNINNTDAITAAISDAGAFKFFYIGHAYGAHNGGGGTNKLVFPPPELIRIVDRLKKYNFGVFGGDVVEICNSQSVGSFEDLFVKPLGIPLLNSMGNHDQCLQKIYNFPSTQAFSKDQNTFLVISTNKRKLGKENIDWLRLQLDIFNRNPSAKRIFIFTHRPTFLLLDPSLKNAAYLSNFPVNPDEYFTSIISKVVSKIDANKTVYWFAGDLGMRQSIVYKKLRGNIHLIGSGIYEREDDHFLDVEIINGAVKIKSINFISGQSSELLEYTDNSFVSKKYLPGEPFEEGWTESLLAKLYASVGAGKKILIKLENLTASEAFNFYHLPDTNSILLDKTNCGPSGDFIFFVQFYPLNVKNRRIRARLWNGYHYYASRSGKNRDKCIATFPLPDYPYKFIRTGQLLEGNIVWETKIYPSNLPVMN